MAFDRTVGGTEFSCIPGDIPLTNGRNSCVLEMVVDVVEGLLQARMLKI